MGTLIITVALLGIVGWSTYHRWAPAVWTPVIGGVLAVLTLAGGLPWYLLTPAWILFVPAAIIANNTTLRQSWVTGPVYSWFKKVLPPMSQTEREALEAGDVWWDGELFRGEPDWQQLHNLPKPELSEEEQAFLDNQTETLCKMLDEWKISHEDNDLPPEVWDYLKQEKFFGMIIPKSFGGLEFSAVAHSTIVMKIASKSLTAAVTTMVPNSLGPAELLLHYGTDEQKQHYLPKLATGQEVPCFGLTAPEAGSDAGSIPDKGIVCKENYNGKETLGIRLTWDKRYITLAPVATVLGLAFKLYDPDQLLGEQKDIGITLALVPTSHPGVEIGQRHFPLNIPFQNGPTQGKDVFIPIDWVIGGTDMVGKGWRMLVECLSVGRSISLPALSTASSKLSYLTTGAYARIRKQFKTSIGHFEGVQEAMARIGGLTYMIEATRLMTVGSIDLNVKPSLVSAITKYHLTEKSRLALTDAMDIHAGRAIMMGPRNYLARAYQGSPIGITVEGANILTRNLIIFGQGAIRCHPYVMQEMEAAHMEDSSRGLELFDKAFISHIGYSASNFVKTLFHGLTGARFARDAGNDITARYYQQLNRMSSALALVADVGMLMLGGELKRKERLSARLGDVLSHLYIASAVLKYYRDNNQPNADVPCLRWSLDFCLYEIQTAFSEFFRNFPNAAVGKILKTVIFPFGLPYKQPTDKVGQTVAMDMMKDSEFRKRLTAGCYIGSAEEPIGRVELAFIKMLAAEPAELKIIEAIKQKKIKRKNLNELIADALAADIITVEEAKLLDEADHARIDAIHVDDFSSEYLKGEIEKCPDNYKAQVA